MNREVESRAVCIIVLVQHTQQLSCNSLAHTHTHSALLTMLCWWTSRGTESQEVRLLPNARLQKKKDCAAMLEIELNTSTHTHKALEKCGVTSLIQPCLWINLSLFLSVTSSNRMCNLCSVGVDSNNACFFFLAVGAAREKQEGKKEEWGEKRALLLTDCGAVTFFSQVWVSSYNEFVIV